MPQFDTDLHIHSLHSIGVSKDMTVPMLAKGAKEKGLHIIGTGDATQPDWLQHLRKNLTLQDDILTHDSISFAHPLFYTLWLDQLLRLKTTSQSIMSLYFLILIP